MQSCQQQIVALDTKFIKHRVPNQPAFRKVYLKRRLQLLGREREADEEVEESQCSCCVKSSLATEEVRTSTSYLKLRAQLLRRQCKAQGVSDLQSTKSFSYTTGEVRAVGASPAKSVTFHNKTQSSLTSSLGPKPPLSEASDFHGFHHLSDLHRAPVTHLKFAHNQSHILLASSLDGSLSLHRLDSTPPSVGLQLQGHTAGVTDFDISTRLMTRSPISSTQIDSMNSPAMSLWYPALRMALCVFGLWRLASYSDRLDKFSFISLNTL